MWQDQICYETCLAKFAVTFDVASNCIGDMTDNYDEVMNWVASANGSSSNNNANNLDRSKHCAEQIQLKDNLGYMRKGDRRQYSVQEGIRLILNLRSIIMLSFFCISLGVENMSSCQDLLHILSHI